MPVLEGPRERFERALVRYAHERANGVSRIKVLAALLIAAGGFGASYGLRHVTSLSILGRTIDLAKVAGCSGAISSLVALYLWAEPTLRQRRASGKLDRAMDGMVELHNRYIDSGMVLNEGRHHYKQQVVGSLRSLSDDANVRPIWSEVYRRFKERGIDLSVEATTEAEDNCVGGRVSRLNRDHAEQVALLLGGCDLESEQTLRQIFEKRFGMRVVELWSREIADECDLPANQDEWSAYHHARYSQALIDRAVVEAHPGMPTPVDCELQRLRSLLALADEVGIDAVEKGVRTLEQRAEAKAKSIAEHKNVGELFAYLVGIDTSESLESGLRIRYSDRVVDRWRSECSNDNQLFDMAVLGLFPDLESVENQEDAQFELARCLVHRFGSQRVEEAIQAIQ